MKNSKKNNELMVTDNAAKLQKLSSSVIMLIVGIIMLVIGIFAIHTTVFFNVVIDYASELCFFKVDSILFNLIFSVFSIIVLYILYKKILPKIDEKILVICAIAFSLLLGFFWTNYIQFKPLADQSMVVYCAESLLDNNLTTILEPGEYLNRNPHQLGYVIYIMTVFQIFDTRTPLFLQNLNVIYSTVNLVLLYLICKEIFTEDIVKKLCLLLIAFFSVYWMFFNVHIYGNVPGLMFALLAVLFTFKYINKADFYKIIIVAISITIAYMLKSNYQIFQFAILIILGLHTLKQKHYSSIIAILAILITTFGFKALVYTSIERLTGYSLDTGVDMTAYVYMGIAEPRTLSPGWYTADVESIYNSANFDTEASKEIAQNLLIERIKYLLSDLSYTFDYFSAKLRTTWLNPTFQVHWCSTPSTLLKIDPAYNNHIAPKRLLISILTGTAFKIQERILDIYQIVTFISAGIGLFFSWKEGNLKKSLLATAFFGGFIFHIIWETKAIYVIHYFYIMLPFAAFGLYKIFQKTEIFLEEKFFATTSQTENSDIPNNHGAKIIEFRRKD